MSRAPKKHAGSKARKRTAAAGSKKTAKSAKKQALLRSNDAVRRQAPQSNGAERTSTAALNKAPGLPKSLLSSDNSETANRPATAEAARSALPAMAFWSPMELMFRQQALMATIMLNVVRNNALLWGAAQVPAPRRSP